VCLSVGRSGKCTVAKQLSESECHWDGEWVGRGINVLDAGGDCQREGAILGVNLGHPIVTNGAFVA